MDKVSALRKYFGLDGFRPGQERLIDDILSGRDCLGIMPTGGGKSLCYQLPALLLPGLTLVVSPLISLMKDQVEALREDGIPAAYLNSSLDTQERREVLAGLGQPQQVPQAVVLRLGQVAGPGLSLQPGYFFRQGGVLGPELFHALQVLPCPVHGPGGGGKQAQKGP